MIPTTYLTDESQTERNAPGITIEGETPKVDQEILKWQMPVRTGAAATASRRDPWCPRPLFQDTKRSRTQ